MPRFRWTEAAKAAAELVAAGELTTQEIADRVGVVRSTLWVWRNHPDFADRVEVHRAAIRAEIFERGIARRELRVKALNDRWNRMRRVIEARADHESFANAPGGSTGLLVRTLKKIGSGEDAELVEEFAVDTGLLRELREHEKQAAQELGQWDAPERAAPKEDFTFDVPHAANQLPHGHGAPA